MSKFQSWLLIGVITIGVGLVVQMNRYKYMDQNPGSDRAIVLVDRLTGNKCFLFGSEDKHRILNMPWC
jgi:hypothetical protein